MSKPLALLITLAACSHDDTQLSWQIQEHPLHVLDYGDAVCFVSELGSSCLARCPSTPLAAPWDKSFPVLRQDGPGHSCFVSEHGVSCVQRCPQ